MRMYKIFRTESTYIDKDDQANAREFASHVEANSYEELFDYSGALLDDANRTWGNLDHRLGRHHIFIWCSGEPEKMIRLDVVGSQSTTIIDQEPYEVGQ